MTIPDGWCKVNYRGGGANCIWLVKDGAIEGESIEEMIEDGFTFEPVVVLTVEEHKQLTIDAGAGRMMRQFGRERLGQ